ncbi:MAG: DNA methyltransferase [Chloroflexi bacterium RBG_16_48_7]|nr:MAG: DNA methyltransferase [Chloroflexi bacterium RBG_16_48_7]
MHQLELFSGTPIERPVNVASVPQRSPFRYPGGKTWLIPQIRRWLDNLGKSSDLLIEPFAGGGIVGLTAAFEKLTNRVLLVELDENVASVWQALLSGSAKWLADEIMNFDMTQQSVTERLGSTDSSLQERAFKTLLRNRVSHGGIMAPGAGLIKFGESKKGISSRWYPQTLAKRISDIDRIRDRINFVHDDGLNIVRQYAARSDVVFFIDPPYTAAGKRAGARLYTYNEVNHNLLFKYAESIRGDFLMTYDKSDEVIEMARQHGFKVAEIAMRNTHHTQMSELLIGKDLQWISSSDG